MPVSSNLRFANRGRRKPRAESNDFRKRSSPATVPETEFRKQVRSQSRANETRLARYWCGSNNACIQEIGNEHIWVLCCAPASRDCLAASGSCPTITLALWRGRLLRMTKSARRSGNIYIGTSRAKSDSKAARKRTHSKTLSRRSVRLPPCVPSRDFLTGVVLTPAQVAQPRR